MRKDKEEGGGRREEGGRRNETANLVTTGARYRFAPATRHPPFATSPELWRVLLPDS
jgi:hypothetical protein